VHELTAQLTRLRMYVEAAIDFPEEEIDFLSDHGLLQGLRELRESFRELLARASQGRLLRDGMTLVIGGFYAVLEVDNKEGVPILGDIPVLKYLFNRTKKTKMKSELDFFVTPFIVKHRLDTGIITPPGERDRLARVRAHKEGRTVDSAEDRAAREGANEADPR